MKTYHRRFIETQSKKISQKSLEYHNGIIWSIDTTEHQCGVKIIGSTESLTIPFPPSWQVVPSWVQLGSPIQIRNRAGIRNALEITGPGHVIPSPEEGDFIPDVNVNLEDIILSGCEINELEPDPIMGVVVHTGSVRINGSTIELEALKMDSTVLKMDMGDYYMNDIAAVTTLSAAPGNASNARFDMFSAGTDGIVDLSTGTTFLVTNASATIPATATNHIRLGKILIACGTTAIRECLINAEWSSVYAHALNISIDDTDLLSVETTAAVTVQVRDQYNNALVRSGKGWRLELEIAHGNGYVVSTEGTSTSLIGAYAGSSAEYVFTYKRLDVSTDITPTLRARLINPLIEKDDRILLRDSSGEVMTT